MTSIIRNDGTKLALELFSNGNSKVAIIVSGFGYSTSHPLLYYSKVVARQNGYDILSIDFEYLSNEIFLKLSPNLQDEYFDKDVELLLSRISKLDYSSRLFIGKSMGTTTINRFISAKMINQNDKLVFITPGNEWHLISKRLETMKNSSLVIGSLADPKYTSIELEQIHKIPNVDFLEFEKENHGLEINEYANDIAVIKKVIDKINDFINK